MTRIGLEIFFAIWYERHECPEHRAPVGALQMTDAASELYIGIH